MSPLSALYQVIFPATCAACGHVLMAGERQLCLDCLSSLNVTCTSPIYDNTTERMLASRFPLEAAMSLYQFQQDSTIQRVIHAMKYHGNSELCYMMGRQMGIELLHSGRFDDVDLLVPVPLHWRRRLQRGFNQSELLCRGIAEVMPRDISKGDIIRHRYTKKQSLQAATNRGSNVEGAFRIRKPEHLRGRHLLLVDDVLTTGATLGACIDAIRSVEGLRLSIATLSVVR